MVLEFFSTLGLEAKVKNLVSSVSIHIRIDHANEDSKKTETNTVRPGMRRETEAISRVQEIMDIQRVE
jgi:hypothetical protein